MSGDADALKIIGELTQERDQLERERGDKIGELASLREERDDWLRRCAACVVTKGKIMQERDTATRRVEALEAEVRRLRNDARASETAVHLGEASVISDQHAEVNAPPRPIRPDAADHTVTLKPLTDEQLKYLRDLDAKARNYDPMIPSARKRIAAVYDQWINSEPDIEALHEEAMEQAYRDGYAAALAQLRETSEELVAAVRAGCNAADIHLRCSYPECACKQTPTIVRAALAAAADAMEADTTKPARGDAV